MQRHTLPMEYGHAAVANSREAEKFVDQRRLADAGFAGDEDQLAHTLARPAEMLVELVQLRLTSDEASTLRTGRRCPTVDLRRQRRGLVTEIGTGCWRLLTDVGDEAKSPPVGGFDEARIARIVAENPAQLSDRLRQRVFHNCGVLPDLAVEVRFGHQATGALDQVAEHVPRLRSQRDCSTLMPQPLTGDIHAKRPEDKLPDWFRCWGLTHPLAREPFGAISERFRDSHWRDPLHVYAAK